LKNYIHVLLISFLLFSPILPQNILSFDYSGGDSLKINLVNEESIAGIELKINGINMLSASGGSAEEAGFTLSASGSTVLGFSFTGTSIPPGESRHMTTIFFDSDLEEIDTPCFSTDYETTESNNILYDCTLSSEAGTPLELELGACADGCFNNLGCNFLTDGECVLPTNYYQDADGDGLGNPDVSQTSCEDIDGFVANNSDDDDTCEGTISDLDGSCCISEIFDECGVCNGDGPIENFDCDGNCLIDIDCLGNCGGSAEPDDCGDCNGNNSAKDACGNCDGDCIENIDGIIVCSGIENTPGNLVVADCNGVCGGTANQCLSLYDNMANDFSITSTYPNPFNPSINIEYSVPSVSYVNLQIIGLDGKHVNTITNSIQTQGKYNVQWTPENVPSGMYLVQLNANNQIQNKKIVYLK